ncbi:30S ribosomal protein S13 [Candidatus Wolfebacteria bacterium CG18_big_fil_WC_8_21_14_2_50_39_7]|uniref:Small ribosomal subunit protein uS13 n=5 Tax=Candidatus Wolfeibacteriota TaxID=1752735 RepID=A0A2M7Q606_9BACT|nr:30S ribosomal protein S13 [Parcubacteria group bacterium]NCO89440.1 30S ribosomal protein S13 [Candidatus Wolfebacteria bacterium]OIO64559.1 MAG: 30S ribosomal protein S13 [Candidatus Wolfebacteria bacterium CG1_02_39_135]PIP92189.1 MAG: 30S ribosomal protein S13 [Candidatus Wolfebacteria bacterium CG18_big_fil_WC_8_21_14_2_50_39_7]PIU98795.1 MAG: 30S ribosomal protein S13 [Candidatus Wolfebacteria bacterium CG03_land_8_20_14_0_80_39_317]PIY58858.1 MAG: 30S ribosomal protein S13 [Candidatus
MRLVGINIPDNKRIVIALTYVYGIGHSLADQILKSAKIDLNKRAKDLTSEEINRIKEIIERSYKIEGELRQIVKQNIGRLKEIQCYRGIRHLKRLPTRGQRTKTNSRTVRGNVRKTVGSGKRKLEKT